MKHEQYQPHACYLGFSDMRWRAMVLPLPERFLALQVRRSIVKRDSVFNPIDDWGRPLTDEF